MASTADRGHVIAKMVDSRRVQVERPRLTQVMEVMFYTGNGATSKTSDGVMSLKVTGLLQQVRDHILQRR